MNNTENYKAVYFSYPPLILTNSTETLRQQLYADFDADNIPITYLINGLNTDIIIPADACKTPEPDNLAEYVLTGLGNNVVLPTSVRKLGRNFWVAGNGFGSGSSREHAPIAMLNSGCTLVICESVAPIFKRNAIALGLYVSDDFSLIKKIKQGDPIPLDRLTEDLDPLSSDILKSGGLLPYLKKRALGTIKTPEITTGKRDMTIAEKWLAQYFGVPYVKPGDGGFLKPDTGYSYEYTLPLSLKILKQAIGSINVYNPDQIILFNDHLAQDNDPRSTKLQETVRQFAQSYQIELHDAKGGNKVTDQGTLGICHITMADRVQPGIHIGTDSHTPMIAPFGGFVFGVGATDFAGMMLSGEIMAVVPQSVRINLHGNLKPYIQPKDLMLSLIARDKSAKHFLGNVMEFGGSGLETFSPLDLAIMANMSAEAKALTATFDPTISIANYLVRTNRAASVQEALAFFPNADTDAEYSDVINIDLNEIVPTIALPHSPDSGIPLDEVENVKLNKVIIGSCVGGGIEDIRITAYILKNKHISKHIQLIVNPHSLAALQFAQEKSWLQWITDAGGEIVRDIGCGACIGAGPGTLDANDICITTDSRNHIGRMGHSNALVYLSSSVVSATAALIGRIPNVDDIISSTQNVPWNEKISLFSKN